MNEAKARVWPGRAAAQWLLGGALMIAVAIAAVSVHAQGRPHGEHAMPGGPMMFGGPPEMLLGGLDRMLDGLNVTEAQRGQIRQIAKGAATDLRAQRDAGRALREKGMQIFTAPTVDAAAAESLRQQALALHDQASKRVLQAMLDISKVLTPEQRVKIGERMKDRQAIMRDRMQRMEHTHRGPGPQASAPR